MSSHAENTLRYTAESAPRTSGLVPIQVLTGFLGSGKTTLLRHLLAHPAFEDTAVVINEFGEAGLDHLLVREVAEDVVLLASGCLCCSVRDDLVSTLAELHALMRSGAVPAFRRMVVETTGLADPAPILQAILGDRRLTGFARRAQVITTVDAVNGAQALVRHREARQQVALADRVIVTKTDLAGCPSLVEKISALNPTAKLLSSSRTRFPAPGMVLDDSEPEWRPPADADPAPHVHDGHRHDDAIRSFTVRVEQPVLWAAFVDWLELLLMSRGDSILRVKGLLPVAGEDRPVVVQGVQHMVYPPERLPHWPAGSAGAGWIVFIARDLTPSAVETSLASVYDHGFA